MAPPSGYVKQRSDAIHLPRYDIVVLVETTSSETAHRVQEIAEYAALVDALRSKASDLHIIVARNVKRVGDVEKRRKGVFLFNYFVGEDPQVTLALWDYLAGWYAVETEMDNSTLLLPLEGERSDYLIINHARWNGLLRFMWQQMTRNMMRSVSTNQEDSVKKALAFFSGQKQAQRVTSTSINSVRFVLSGKRERFTWHR